MRMNAAGIRMCVLILLSVFVIYGTAVALPGRKSEGSRSRETRNDTAPKVEDAAPTFTLKSLDGKSETDLAAFRDKKPVVLFFGSYT